MAPKADGLELAVSAAMGKLEANGYGNVGQMGALLGFGFSQKLRDARSSNDTTHARVRRRAAIRCTGSATSTRPT